MPQPPTRWRMRCRRRARTRAHPPLVRPRSRPRRPRRPDSRPTQLSELQAAAHEQDVTRGGGSTPWVRRVCLRVLVAGWALVLALILGHRIFVSHDTVSNYAHVWYVSERVGHAHVLPFRMPVIGHGDAYA